MNYFRSLFYLVNCRFSEKITNVILGIFKISSWMKCWIGQKKEFSNTLGHFHSILQNKVTYNLIKKNFFLLLILYILSYQFSLWRQTTKQNTANNLSRILMSSTKKTLSCLEKIQNNSWNMFLWNHQTYQKVFKWWKILLILFLFTEIPVKISKIQGKLLYYIWPQNFVKNLWMDSW